MDGFHYVNIFATKGIEYLLIIGFLILFVFYFRALVKDPGGKKPQPGRKAR